MLVDGWVSGYAHLEKLADSSDGQQLVQLQRLSLLKWAVASSHQVNVMLRRSSMALL